MLGKGSLSLTLVASSGPLLTMVRVKVMVSLMLGEKSLTVLVKLRSAPLIVSVTVVVIVVNVSALVMAAILVITRPRVKGVLTVTAKVTVTCCPVVMVSPLTSVGGSTPLIPAPGGSSVIVPLTKLV